MSVDFDGGASWRDGLVTGGFDVKKPAIVASTGLSMYLTKDANAATLRQVAALAPGSTLAMSFLLPLDLSDPESRSGLQAAKKGAGASGTPFISFFTPAQMLALARETGFKAVEHVSAAALTERYFAGRTDGLRPPLNAEELLVARTSPTWMSDRHLTATSLGSAQALPEQHNPPSRQIDHGVSERTHRVRHQ